MAIELRRIAAVAAQHGISISLIYEQISDGLMVRPVNVSAQARRIPGHEADAVAAARIAGKSDAEIKALVASLMAKRADALIKYGNAA